MRLVVDLRVSGIFTCLLWAERQRCRPSSVFHVRPPIWTGTTRRTYFVSCTSSRIFKVVALYNDVSLGFMYVYGIDTSIIIVASLA